MQSRTIRFVASLSFFVLVVGLALLATACPPAPEATTFAVNYDANGATGGSAPDEQIKDAGVDIVLASNSGGLNRSGYRFLGWNDRADGSGQAYAEAAIYAADKDILLFAAWSVIPTYTVSYNSNGGTGGTLPPPQTKIQGLALTLASNTGNLARAGYSFWGWNTAADGTGTAYEQGSNYTQDASIILYASWTQGSFPVTYDDNYAHSGTPPSNQTKIQGQALIIATNSGNLGKTNHSFGGLEYPGKRRGHGLPRWLELQP